jgi:hypothetical protein
LEAILDLQFVVVVVTASKAGGNGQSATREPSRQTGRQAERERERERERKREREGKREREAGIAPLTGHAQLATTDSTHTHTWIMMAGM